MAGKEDHTTGRIGTDDDNRTEKDRKNNIASSTITMASSERKPSRSRLRDFWRILFAIVGILDCSCYYYSYYQRNEYLSEKNAVAKQKRRPPMSCSRREERQGYDERRFGNTKTKYDTEDEMESRIYVSNSRSPESNHPFCRLTPDVPDPLLTSPSSSSKR